MSPRALATTVGDLPCTGGPTACILDAHADIAVSPGSILDFGTRDLTIKRATSLRVGPTTGPMTILAKSVTLEPGASLFAPGGQIAVTTTGDIRIAASGGNVARIDVSANLGGGSVSLNAGGRVDIAGILNAKAPVGDGGSIDVTAATRVDLSGEIISTGRGTGAGGSISLKTTAGPIAVDGIVDVSGTEGGGGDIDIQGSAGVTTSVMLDASGGGSGGSGGSISILSTAGAIVMHAGVDGRGAPAGSQDFGGTGAVIEVSAAQNVAIEGQLVLTGGAPDGEGGAINIQADGDLVFNNSILAQGNGVDGCGSPDGINLTARGDIVLNDIDVSGGTCGGGSIDLFAGGKISLAAPFEILAEGTGPFGFAGVISMVGESLQIDGDMSAGSDEFIGGDIALEACGNLTIAAGSVVSSAGVAGTTALLARGLLRVAGKVFSGVPPLGSQGANTIEYRATPPNLTGSSILPPPTLTGGLEPCDLCGNLIVNAGEQCDDGNRVNDAACDANCTFPACGNGIVDPGEVCDDGNNVPCDGCNTSCSRTDNICGDTVAECGEGCDDGNATSCDGCKGDCTRLDNVCGDHTIECGEECDDGNVATLDGCNATCRLEPPPDCGNGTKSASEGCDDGNLVDGDGCSHLCQLEGCGNGIVDSGEQCDDHNIDACDGCSADCSHIDNACGDGITECGELCDDGNLDDGDGCDTNCTPTGCGNGIMTPAEACDDGNINACDGCAANCTRGDDICGDGIVECSEDCDPPGVGCNGTCHLRFSCITDTDCHPSGRCAGKACIAGTCISVVPLACDDGNPCTTDSCDPAHGCRHVSVLDGTSCSDGNACTRTDSCESGTCVGAASVVCTALDQCHVAGTCDTATGLCSNPTKVDGALCDDDDLCTQTDTCAAGICVGTAPVVCTARDECHTAGTCEPATGVCSNPVAPDGKPCDDGNACTTAERCEIGTCVGTPETCDDGELCTDDPTCDPAIGCAPSSQKIGIASITCQLDAMGAALAEGGDQVQPRTRSRIERAAAKARAQLAAADSAGTPKRARKKLSAARGALKDLAKVIRLARKKHQLSDPLGDMVETRAGSALGALEGLRI